VFPAAALLITTLAFNLLGDGIRDAMDPRTERVLAARRGRGERRRRRARQVLAEDGGGIGGPGPGSYASPAGGD
jgi:hypothetical protein